MAPPNVIYVDGAPRIDGGSGGRTGEEEIRRAAMVQAQQQRRKGIATRAWLVVLESGQSHVEEIEKHSIMGWTSLPTRNLLVLDQVLSSPSSILGRKRAVLVNLRFQCKDPPSLSVLHQFQ